MSKTLVIVESPGKIKKVQEYLGNSYIVKASIGHITELAKGGYRGTGIDLNGFKPRYALMDDKVSVLDDLMKTAKNCDKILIASDPDREGEAIAWHLRERLIDMGKPIKRIKFNEIEKNAIKKALNQELDINMNLFKAQEARRILDRLVGFIASPFLMNFFGPKLSAGRVQSVVTRMIIDREEEIDTFVPEEFFTISVSLTDGKTPFDSKYPVKITDKNKASDLDKKFKSNNEYVVTSVIADEEKRYAPQPLITSTLQQVMSKKYSMSVDRTMKAAQSLYEGGYCSYIRTDSVRLSDDIIASIRAYLKDNGFSIPNKPNVFKNKDSAQDAHEAIHPVDINYKPDGNFGIIDPDEALVYKEIWNYFVASQMLPAIYSTLKVTFEAKNDKECQLQASGKAIKYSGFLEILSPSDQSSIDIPNLNKGDIVKLTQKNPVLLEKKKTQPPPRYSEYALVKELEKRNIGRPSTYAELLSKITTRNYVEKRGNVYHPTDLGKKITNILKDHFTFMDYDYTSKLEEMLDGVESSKINYVDMLDNFYKKFSKEVEKAYVDYGGKICEKCQSPMVIKLTKKGDKFLGCSGYPNCKNTINLS